MTPNAAKILICDDDELLLELLHFRLAANGYSVAVAKDGREALKSAENDVPDAVVLDAMMPVLDGFQVIRAFRASDLLAKVPIILLTARKQETDILEALRLGASDYLAKPFIPEELLARLAKLLEGRPA